MPVSAHTQADGLWHEDLTHGLPGRGLHFEERLIVGEGSFIPSGSWLTSK